MSDDLSALFAHGDLTSMDDDALLLASEYFLEAIAFDLPHLPVELARAAAIACLGETAERCARRGWWNEEVQARTAQEDLRGGNDLSAPAVQDIEAFLISGDAAARSTAVHWLLGRARDHQQLDEAARERALQMAGTWLATRPPEQPGVQLLGAVRSIAPHRFWPLAEAELERATAAVLAPCDGIARVDRMRAYLDINEMLTHVPKMEDHRGTWAAAQRQRAIETVGAWARTADDITIVVDHPWYLGSTGPREESEQLGGVPAILSAWERAGAAVAKITDDASRPDPARSSLAREQDHDQALAALRSELAVAVSLFERGCTALTSIKEVASLRSRFVQHLLDSMEVGDPRLMGWLLTAAQQLNEEWGLPLSVRGLESYINARASATDVDGPDMAAFDAELEDLDPEPRLVDVLRHEDGGSDGPPERTAYLDLTDEELALCLEVRTSTTHELSDDTVAALRSAIATRVALGAGDALREQISACTDRAGRPLHRWLAELELEHLRQGLGDPDQLAARVVTLLTMAGISGADPLDAEPHRALEQLAEEGFDVAAMVATTLATVTDPANVTAQGCGCFADAVARIAQGTLGDDAMQGVWRAMGQTVRRLDAADPERGLVASYRTALSSHLLAIQDGRPLLDFDGEHRASWRQLPMAPGSRMHIKALCRAGKYGEAFDTAREGGPPPPWTVRLITQHLLDTAVNVPYPTRSTPGIELRHDSRSFRQPSVARRVARKGERQHPVRGSDGARLPMALRPAPPRPHGRPTYGMGPGL